RHGTEPSGGSCAFSVMAACKGNERSTARCRSTPASSQMMAFSGNLEDSPDGLGPKPAAMTQTRAAGWSQAREFTEVIHGSIPGPMAAQFARGEAARLKESPH